MQTQPVTVSAGPRAHVLNRSATVEVVEESVLARRNEARGLCEVTEADAHGLKGLVWARYPIHAFRATPLGYSYEAVGIPGTRWVHEQNWRNLELAAVLE